MRPALLLALAVGIALSPGVARADFFVITATSDSQEAAQGKAAETGGWVLPTGLYPKLKPGLFAVVRGPYASAKDASGTLRRLQSGGHFKGAYVKDAGTLQLGPALAGKTPPSVLAALLGELTVTLEERPGGRHPCEPEEPYVEVRLSYTGVTRSAEEGGGVKTTVQPLDIGLLALIKRTGEIERMRICLE